MGNPKPDGNPISVLSVLKDTNRMLKTIPVLAIIFIGFVSVAVRGGSDILQIIKASEPSDFMSGSLAGKIDKAVFRAIPKDARLDGAASGLLYWSLNDAGPQVWAGCSGWLYSIEELQVGRHDTENVTARAEILRRVVRIFADRGIFLVILPIPDKAEQVEDHLCGVHAEQSRVRERMWRDLTKSVQIEQLDLKSLWPYPGYWMTDTHWNSEGALFAANAVARSVNATLGAGTERIRLTKEGTHDRTGDLVRLAGLTDAPRWLAPLNEREATVRVEIGRSGGLLDEAPAPSVILAGSSYSLNSGFNEYLQASLAREVSQQSQSGGGFAGALLEIIQRKPAVLAKVKAVIWEWPMRSLTAPLTESERLFLKQSPDNPQ
jgi:alginate O-acetyltransferase complex protein AlgJ